MKKLNLHGIKHKDVTRKVIHFIEDHWDSDEEVEIIVGNSNKMRKIVIAVLNEYSLCYRIGHMFTYDKGCLIISMG